MNRFVNHPANAAGDSKLVARREHFDTGVSLSAEPESTVHRFECEYDGKALRMKGLPSSVPVRFRRVQAAFVVRASTNDVRAARPKIWIGRLVVNGMPIAIPEGVDRLREDDVSTGRQR